MKSIYMITFVLIAGLAGCTNTVGEQRSPVMRDIAVLSNEPMDLRLCDRSCDTVASFVPSWEQTGRGYETTIQVSTRHFYGTSFLKLIRADDMGWSDWGSEEITYLRGHNVSSADPACVGGRNWCAVRGL
jgi:hypothetical protein